MLTESVMPTEDPGGIMEVAGVGGEAFQPEGHWEKVPRGVYMECAEKIQEADVAGAG